MFREPTWFASVDYTSFDVIHLHLFALRQVGTAVPVMSTVGYPLTELYRYRECWGEHRLRRAEALERTWARQMHVHIPWLNQVDPSIMSAYSPTAREFLVSHGADPMTTRIIGTAAPMRSAPRRGSSGKALLFVGRDFRRKGGQMVLAAFRELRDEGQDVTLTVVTSAADAPRNRDLDVAWVLDPDRDELLHDVYPRHDVLVAPTASDCGAPYSVLEALQSGLAVVLSDLPWLDDRLRPPAVTRVARDPYAIAEALRSWSLAAR